MPEIIYRIASEVGSPLALAGVICVLFASVTLAIIKQLAPTSPDETIIVVKKILNGFFILAIVAVLLGAAGWGYAKYVEHDLQKARRAEQMAAIDSYSGLVSTLRTETDRLIDKYPSAYAILLRSGQTADEARETLFGRERRRIDEICGAYKVGSMVRATFPAFGWDLFFKQGKQHYQEFRDAVHDAVVAGQYEQKRPLLRELQKDYMHHLEQRLSELREQVGSPIDRSKVLAEK